MEDTRKIGATGEPSDGTTASGSGAASKGMLWTGWILTAIPVAMLLFSAIMKFAKPAALVEEFARLGWPDRLAVTIGVVELAVTLIYLFPRTAVLGAILVTGYLGGATATHVRIGDPWYGPVVFGVLIWLGLFLRDARLRRLVPYRSRSAPR